mgnify:CR=1 FL=1
MQPSVLGSPEAVAAGLAQAERERPWAARSAREELQQREPAGPKRAAAVASAEVAAAVVRPALAGLKLVHAEPALEPEHEPEPLMDPKPGRLPRQRLVVKPARGPQGRCSVPCQRVAVRRMRERRLAKAPLPTSRASLRPPAAEAAAAAAASKQAARCQHYTQFRSKSQRPEKRHRRCSPAGDVLCRSPPRAPLRPAERHSAAPCNAKASR